MSEWSSVYTMDLFALTEEASRSMYTTSNNIYEAASILSLLLFGELLIHHSLIHRYYFLFICFH